MSAKLEMSLDDIIKTDRKNKKSTPRATPGKDKPHHPIKARKETKNINNDRKMVQKNRRDNKEAKLTSFRMDNKKNLEISITNDRFKPNRPSSISRSAPRSNHSNSRFSPSSMMVIDREGSSSRPSSSRNERPSMLRNSSNQRQNNRDQRHHQSPRSAPRNSSIRKP